MGSPQPLKELEPTPQFSATAKLGESGSPVFTVVPIQRRYGPEWQLQISLFNLF